MEPVSLPRRETGFATAARSKDCSEANSTGVPIDTPTFYFPKATLSFVGKEIFVGDASRVGDDVLLRVERALPVLPMMDDRTGLQPDVLAQLNWRSAEEMEQRGQSLPIVPASPPSPTVGTIYRKEAARPIDPASVGGRISK